MAAQLALVDGGRWSGDGERRCEREGPCRAQRGASIEAVRLLEKSGGKSGDYRYSPKKR